MQGQAREALDHKSGETVWSQSEILPHLADFEVACFQSQVETILRGGPVLAINPDKRAADVPWAISWPSG